MRVTNNSNLPEAVFRFLAEDRYDPGSSEYSVTTLLNPPQLVQLQRRYWDELEEDAIDRVWSVFGTAVHNLFEDHTKDGVAEERLYAEIDGVRVGGQMDHVKDGVITDYKVTSVYKVMKGEPPREWVEQQNIYAYLQHVNGREIKKLQICAILRDWSRSKAKFDRTYPQAPLLIIDLPLWGLEFTEDFLRERVRTHTTAETLTDEELSYNGCSDEEVWAQPTKYAVMERGKKRAFRVFDSPDECEALIVDNHASKNYYMEVRPGKRTRCEDFCSVKNYCQQYRRYLNG